MKNRANTKEQMLKDIIEKFGINHSITIDFNVIINDKQFNDKMITDLYRGLMDI